MQMPRKEPNSTAMMCLWNDIDAEIEPEYEAWYQRDHLRDRIGTPGFRSCRRYVRVSGPGRQYLTFNDLDDIHARAAAEAGVLVLIDSDAHDADRLKHVRWGVATARRAWLGPEQIANTRPWAEFASLRKRVRATA